LDIYLSIFFCVWVVGTKSFNLLCLTIKKGIDTITNINGRTTYVGIPVFSVDDEELIESSESYSDDGLYIWVIEGAGVEENVKDVVWTWDILDVMLLAECVGKIDV
jgi:hypothetical protein